MKKILLLLFIALLPLLTFAQSPQGRAPKTIIADVLAKMPAQNAAIYNQMMTDLVASGAEGLDILNARMSFAPGDDNVAVSYAIDGLSNYVTGGNREKAREMVTASLIKALDKSGDKEVKRFFIRQIQIAGGDDAVEAMSRYAVQSDYCQQAVSALMEFDTPKSKATLESLAGSLPDKKVAAKVVGDCAIASCEPMLLGWLGSDDAALQKSVLYGLSRSGSVASLGALRSAAQAVEYGSESSGATHAYLTLLGRLSAKEASKDLNNLLKSPNADLRVAAITTLAAVDAPKAKVLTIKTLSSADRKYVNAALRAVKKDADETFCNTLIAKLPKLEPKVAADVVAFLGELKVKLAVAAIVPFVGSADAELRKSATTALSRIAEPAGLVAMISTFKDGSKEVIKDSRDALLWYPANFNGRLTEALPGACAEGKVAIIEILSAKRAADAAKEVLQCATGNDQVAKAAFKALEHVSTQAQLEQLCKMLESASGANTADLQRAIGAVLSKMPKGQALLLVESKMQRNSAIYYPVLSYIGSPAAFAIVSKGVESKDAAEQKAAVETVVKWSDIEALGVLLDLFSNPAFNEYHDAALASYIKLLNVAKYNDVQKFIHLRNAIEKATTPVQKNMLLAQMAGLNSFNALILAGEYLSQSETEQQAGNVVMNIALRDKQYAMFGQPVRDILTKFIAVRKGGDAQYDIAAVKKYLAEAPAGDGFVAIFNGENLAGWKGLVGNPIARAKMKPAELAKQQAAVDKNIDKSWQVRDGVLYFTGSGDNLCTEKKYGDFEMYVDWRIEPLGDAGIYLRGAPQVQIWDTSRVEVGAQVGSGGLYNNIVNQSKPAKVADNPVGEWNTFYIKMIGERVTVHLNGVPVVDNVILENYWDRALPIFDAEQLELQAHGTEVAYRDIYVKELPKAQKFELSAQEKAEGYKVLFDGTSLNQWVGNTKDYVTENGTITLYPGNGGGGNLYTKEQFADFIFRFEFKLTPGANNGLGVRTPTKGDAAYVGVELQILDNDASIYKDLFEYQYHGSAYGLIPAKRGYLKPMGEWNYEEVEVRGNNYKVTLNGTVILDGNLDDAIKSGVTTYEKHPGVKNKTGHIAFLGHGSEVSFKNIRIKELK